MGILLFLLFHSISCMSLLKAWIFFSHIVILCTNNIFIEILRLLDSTLRGNFFCSYEMLINLLFTTLLTAIEFLIILIGMKYF